MGQTVMAGQLAQLVFKAAALAGCSWCQNMQMGQAAHGEPCPLENDTLVQELDHRDNIASGLQQCHSDELAFSFLVLEYLLKTERQK